MRIDVIGKHHLEITDAIRKHAESKAEKLLKFFDGTMQIRIYLEQGKKGEFNAELVVDLVKHKEIVSHATHSDPYACIDQAVEKSERQVKDFKEKLRS